MTHNHHVPLRHILLVFYSLLSASLLSHQSGFDRLLAEAFYHVEGGVSGPFPWRANYWLYNVIHEGGRWLVKRLFFINLGLWIASLWVKPLKAWRPAFGFICLSTLLSTSLISELKHVTTTPCPDALVEFGGTRQWIDVWQAFNPSLPHGSCYPAGHASGGYAWLCLAYLFPYGRRSFYVALLPGLILGLSFGIAQQLRGAHFLSHDLLTIALSWLIAGLIFHSMQATRNLWSLPAGNLAQPAES